MHSLAAENAFPSYFPKMNNCHYAGVQSMKKSKILLCVAMMGSVMVFTGRAAHAQGHPPREFGGPLWFSFPVLTTYPPFQTDMPYSILLAYVGYDSLARHADKDSVQRMLKNLTYSDTAKYAAKFLFEIVDYNPVKFFQWAYTSPESGMYKNSPANLRKRFVARVDSIAPATLNTIPLLMADYIAEVKVTNTESSVDSTASLARSAELVTSYVVDTIKGHRTPFCMNEQFKSNNDRRSQSAYGACLQFDYRLEWRRMNHASTFTNEDSTLVDADGKPWVKQGGEYIVFLSFANLQRDSERNYATLTPVVGWGTSVCMYPIIDGYVYDPYNDFGYGTNLTVDQFKTALRNNIYSLTHP
jgi:hypothetical protein